MSQKAGIRRRKQAANNYKHLPPLRRPHYAGYSAVKAQRRMEKIAAKRAAGNMLAGGKS